MIAGNFLVDVEKRESTIFHDASLKFDVGCEVSFIRKMIKTFCVFMCKG